MALFVYASDGMWVIAQPKILHIYGNWRKTTTLFSTKLVIILVTAFEIRLQFFPPSPPKFQLLLLPISVSLRPWLYLSPAYGHKKIYIEYIYFLCMTQCKPAWDLTGLSRSVLYIPNRIDCGVNWSAGSWDFPLHNGTSGGPAVPIPIPTLIPY